MNLRKTNVMWIGEQDVYQHIVIDGKMTTQVDSFMYFGKQCVKKEEVAARCLGSSGGMEDG